jgi:CRISPR-associated exonuclease Cas4
MHEDDYVPIYSLAEWHYCPRSAFLSWFGAERRDQVTPAYQKMREAHAVSAEPSRRDKNGIKTETAVPLLHTELKITGRADAVEWQDGTPIPVEYKNCGNPPPSHILAQVALQGLCLSLMHDKPVRSGVIFRIKERRRIPVSLNEETYSWIIEGVHSFRASLPRGIHGFPPRRQEGCGGCIYRTHCWPEEYTHV